MRSQFSCAQDDYPRIRTLKPYVQGQNYRLKIDMSEQKLRRKSFIFSMGALALGWIGLRGAPVRDREVPSTSVDGRVKRDPRAVSCSGRTL